ncbi:MAG TPA: acyloxyacyl hydrolase [Thermoanaerobaculia bacterium]
MRNFTIAVLALFAGSMSAQTFDDIRVVAAGGKSSTTWHGQADVQSLQLELGHALSSRSTVAIAGGVVNLWQPRSWFGDLYGDGNESVRALAVSLLLRHAWRPQASVRPYLEGGTGPLVAEKRVPASTSRFNFASQAGAGLVFNARGRMPVFAGYRFLHISNGGYSPRNPGLNVSAAVVGVQLRNARPRQR